MARTRPQHDHTVGRRPLAHVASRLTRKAPGGPFYYRRRDPRAASHEISLSLGVRGYRYAYFLAEALDAQLVKLLAGDPSMTLTDLRRILRTHLSDLLDEDMARRVRGVGDAALYAPWFPGHPDHESGVHADLEALDWELTHRREDLQNRNYAAVADDAGKLSRQFSVPHDLQNHLHHGLLEVFVRLAEALNARTLGRDGTVLVDEPGSAPVSAGALATSAPDTTQRLSSVVSAHHAWMRSRGVGVFSLRKSGTALALFQEVCGDKEIDRYTRQDLTLFLTKIRRLPRLHNRGEQDRGKTLDQIIDDPGRAEETRISEATAKGHMKAVAALFDFAVETGLLPHAHPNPAKGFKFRPRPPAREQRDAWSVDELRVLFSTPVYTGRHARWPSKSGDVVRRDALFWLPLLGAFQGARLEELAQLRRADIGCEEGIWFLRITDEGEGQSVKNANSIRRVPLHSELLRVGFLNYLDSVTAASSDQVFPDLEPSGPAKKYGHNFSKAFGAYCAATGLKRPGLVFHSFRHTVTTRLIGAGLTETMVDHLLGRSSGTSETAIRYAKRPELPVLAQALERLTYPGLDLRHLVPSGGVPRSASLSPRPDDEG